MKNNTLIEEALKNDHAIRAVPELVVDWNMNRYVGAVASNTPSDELEGYDAELFPIDSLVISNRPTKGINKARIGSSTVVDDETIDANGTPLARFYIADVDDSYKYWTSPQPSDEDGVMPLFNSTNFPEPEDEVYSHDNLTSVRPKVVYNQDVSVNKIVITTENTWATAKDFQIQVATVASPTEGQWTTVATDESLGNTWKGIGQIVLHYNGNGTALTPWVSSGRVDNADKTPKRVTIRAVRILVNSLEGGYRKTTGTLVPTTYGVQSGINYTILETDGKDSFFDLIEISARLEVDLTPFVVNVEDTFDLGEKSNLYPIGTVTSNVAALALSNLYKNISGDWVPGIFSADNADSPYRNFIDANAEMQLSYRYFDEDDNELGLIQQFKMYVENWTGQSNDIVNLDLMDFSKFFNTAEIKLRPSMWEGLTVSEIIGRILDSVGFVDYEIDNDADRETDHVIPVFYTDGEKNVWETLDELAKASQSAIYFDGRGVLQVKTRDFAMSAADAPVWDFTSIDTLDQLANIVSLDVDTEFEPNYYKVAYQKTDWSLEEHGQPVMQQVWNPESETVTLRGTPLVRDLPVDGPWMWLGTDDVKVWPYEALVNIEGELIRYKGKHFVYYTGATGTTRNTRVVTSNDEYKSFNEMTPFDHRQKNHFSGALAVTERGVWNTVERAHLVEASGYNTRAIINGTRYTNAPGFYHWRNESRVQLLSSTKATTQRDILLATRGSSEDTTFLDYGTRFRLLKQAGRTDQCAGLVINNSEATEDGYYFEFTPSSTLTAKDRAHREEFIFFVREGGVSKVLGKQACAIGENIDYELDVSFRLTSGGDHSITAFLNGKNILDVVVTGADRIATAGRFGMFLRGRTRAEYEYLYAIRHEEKPQLLEDFGFLDKVQRGYMGGQWDREWTYRVSDYKRLVLRKSVKATRRYNRQFFDEFGPIVHEVREFDVKFEPNPVLHSRLYLTNDWSACVVDYVGNPFGAKFAIANTSRRNAVIHGEDSLSFAGTGDAINQVLTVLGRALVIGEAEEVVAENSDQIRRRGKAEAELTSTWIQSKEMAEDVATWMRENFSYGNDGMTMEIFGNPLIEVGDVVSVNYPDKHISGDFFVLGTTTSFENGMSTTLDLRRRTV